MALPGVVQDHHLHPYKMESWGQVFDGTQYMYSGSGASNGPALDNGSITFAPSGLSGRVITAGVRGGSNKTYTVNGQAMTFGTLQC